MLPARPKPAFDWSDARTHSSRRNQDLPVYTSMCKVFVITTVTFTLTLWVHNYSATHPPIPLALYSRTAHGALECNKNDRLTDRPLNYSKIKVLLLRNNHKRSRKRPNSVAHTISKDDEEVYRLYVFGCHKRLVCLPGILRDAPRTTHVHEQKRTHF